jgi:hypothetical protein
MEGVELTLKKRGYPALADMKAKWQRKETLNLFRPKMLLFAAFSTSLEM